ncbi:MAG: thioredoxin [Chloroflexi bacterium]|nr:thioredoxin [Chloroflexota bacterium]
MATLASQQYTVESPLEAIELCYRMGWTDGLPVVPPSQQRVLQFLEHAGREPSQPVLVEPVTGRIVTVEKAAINAVMAGCLPEHFPVVLAALEAMSDPDFNLHGATLNTGGSAVMAVVNGPIVQRIGMNSGVALFCPGNRANATIGRALHLVLWNCTGNRPDELDKTVMGHGGRYSMCIAEREEALPQGWQPFHVERGLPAGSSAVTVFTAAHPLQAGYHGSPDPKEILINVADTMTVLPPWNQELLMVVSPEILRHFDKARWSKADVGEFLFQEARRPGYAVRRAHKFRYSYHAQAAGDQDMLPVLDRPEALDIVAGGGEGGAFVLVVALYGNGIHSRSITREVQLKGTQEV